MVVAGDIYNGSRGEKKEGAGVSLSQAKEGGGKGVAKDLLGVLSVLLEVQVILKGGSFHPLERGA